MIQLGFLSVGFAPGTAGKSDDYLYADLFRQLNTVLRKVWSSTVRLSALSGCTGFPWQLSSRDFNVVVIKFLLPRPKLRRVGQQVVDRAMLIIGIAAGADLRRLHSHLLVLLYQLIESQIRKRGIENANQNFPAVCGLESCDWNLRVD